MKRARLLRYARCQAGDYVVERGIVTLLFSVMTLIGPAIDILTHRAGQHEPSIIMALTTMIFVAVMFSSQGLISQPRKLGYYRLVFAKPVNPLAFYAQLFAVNLVCTIAFTVVAALLFSAFVAHVDAVAVGTLTALSFVLLGGVGFLASSLFNYDSVGVFAFFAASVVLNELAKMYTGLAPRAVVLLMPTEHLLALRTGLVPGAGFAGGDVRWVLGYGVVFFLLGCIVTRYRQLAD